MVRYSPGVTAMVPVTSPWYPPEGGRPDESAPPQLPCPPSAVSVSDVTPAGTVKFCKVSLSKPKVWVTVLGVVAPAAERRSIAAGTANPLARPTRVAANQAAVRRSFLDRERSVGTVTSVVRPECDLPALRSATPVLGSAERAARWDAHGWEPMEAASPESMGGASIDMHGNSTLPTWPFSDL